MKAAVVRYDHARELLAEAEAFLAEREAEHTLPFGIASEIVSGVRRSPRDSYFAAVRVGRSIVGVALRMPLQNLVVSCDTSEIANAIAFDLREASSDLPGVIGPHASGELFARAWEKVSGARASRVMSQWIYVLRER